MNAAAETVLAWRDGDAEAPTRENTARCSGHAAGWVWAGMRRIGPRHRAAGGVCEDALAGKGFAVGSAERLHLALADGVSGGARGDVAAAALVGHGVAYPGVDLDGVMSWMADGADVTVCEALARHTSAPGAATFAGAWLLSDGRGRVTRVGDCRAYGWQHQAEGLWPKLEQLLPDQTLAYMGYVPPRHPKATNPAHMAGNGNIGTLEWREVAIAPGGGLLLCSDGLHGVLPDTELDRALQSALAKMPVADVDRVRLCEDLIDRAQARGSDDDVAVLLAWRV